MCRIVVESGCEACGPGIRWLEERTACTKALSSSSSLPDWAPPTRAHDANALSEISREDERRTIRRKVAFPNSGANDGRVMSYPGQQIREFHPGRRGLPPFDHQPDLFTMQLAQHRRHCIRERFSRPFIEQQCALGLVSELGIGREVAAALLHHVGQAAVMSLVQSARLYGHDPWVYLRDVLTRLPIHPARNIEDLLPHRWIPPVAR